MFSSSLKNRNSKYNGEEDAKKIRRIDDGIYPLTDISLDQDSEQRGEHATPYAVYRPKTMSLDPGYGIKATEMYAEDHA
jgi:hypothetical protein